MALGTVSAVLTEFVDKYVTSFFLTVAPKLPAVAPAQDAKQFEGDLPYVFGGSEGGWDWERFGWGWGQRSFAWSKWRLTEMIGGWGALWLFFSGRRVGAKCMGYSLREDLRWYSGS